MPRDRWESWKEENPPNPFAAFVAWNRQSRSPRYQDLLRPGMRGLAFRCLVAGKDNTLSRSMQRGLTIFSGATIAFILMALHFSRNTDAELMELEKPAEVGTGRKRTNSRLQQKVQRDEFTASPLKGEDGSTSEYGITFRDNLSLDIELFSSNNTFALCEQEINYFKMLKDPNTCGKFIGIELVDGGGADLTVMSGEGISGGVYYNWNQSSLLWNHIPGLDRSAGVTRLKLSKVELSLENLISRLKPTLGMPTLRNSILQEGLRFRIQCDLPSSDGKWVRMKSEWINVSARARQNLLLYLDSENNFQKMIDN